MPRPAGKSRGTWIGEAAQRSVPPASVFDLGISYTLFRLAALDEEDFSQATVRPLSDRYAQATLTEEGFQRGMGVLKVHFDHPDVPNAAIEGISAFVRMLRSLASAPFPEWRSFCKHHDSFNPILHGIAWRPLLRGEAFEPALFIYMAMAAPLSLEQEQYKPRVN